MTVHLQFLLISYCCSTQSQVKVWLQEVVMEDAADEEELTADDNKPVPALIWVTQLGRPTTKSLAGPKGRRARLCLNLQSITLGHLIMHYHLYCNTSCYVACNAVEVFTAYYYNVMLLNTCCCNLLRRVCRQNLLVHLAVVAGNGYRGKWQSGNQQGKNTKQTPTQEKSRKLPGDGQPGSCTKRARSKVSSCWQ